MMSDVVKNRDNDRIHSSSHTKGLQRPVASVLEYIHEKSQVQWDIEHTARSSNACRSQSPTVTPYPTPQKRQFLSDLSNSNGSLPTTPYPSNFFLPTNPATGCPSSPPSNRPSSCQCLEALNIVFESLFPVCLYLPPASLKCHGSKQHLLPLLCHDCTLRRQPHQRNALMRGLPYETEAVGTLDGSCGAVRDR